MVQYVVKEIISETRNISVSDPQDVDSIPAQTYTANNVSIGGFTYLENFAVILRTQDDIVADTLGGAGNFRAGTWEPIITIKQNNIPIISVTNLDGVRYIFGFSGDVNGPFDSTEVGSRGNFLQPFDDYVPANFDVEIVLVSGLTSRSLQMKNMVPANTLVLTFELYAIGRQP